MVTYAPAFRSLQDAQRQFRGRPVRIAKIARRAAGDDEFPEGCDCDHCIAGIDLSGLSSPPTICCTTVLTWSFIDPFTGDERVLKWIGGDQWDTDNFTVESTTDVGCGGNEYVWLMDLSAGTLSMTIAVDNGCDKICLQYDLTSWVKCQCDNVFELRKFANVNQTILDCKVCVKPRVDSVTCDLLLGIHVNTWIATIGAGWTSTLACTDAACENLAGTYGLHVIPPGALSDPFSDWSNPAQCLWYSCWPEHSSASVASGVGTCLDIECQGTPDLAYVILSMRVVAGPKLELWIVFEPIDPTGATTTIAKYRSEELVLPLDTTLTHTLTLVDSFTGCSGPTTIEVTAIDSDASPTSDGLCAGCGEPDTAPVDAEGACCKDGECLDIPEADCTTIAGTWYALDSECSANCGNTDGTCCTCVNDVVTCIGSITSEACTALGGAWTQDYGTDCSLNDCGGTKGSVCVEGVSTFGACCCATGACAENVSSDSCNPAACTNDCNGIIGGNCVDFHANMTCADVTCDPVGSCCIPNHGLEECDCTDSMTEAACNAVDGHWEANFTCAQCDCTNNGGIYNPTPPYCGPSCA